MKHRTALIFWSFFAIYVIWGSTYLAIQIALVSLPPFLLAGIRFLLAGGVLYAWARWRGGRGPARGDWTAAAFMGVMFFLIGNGGVVWAEQQVPSGLAALLGSMTPLWTLLQERLRPHGNHPTPAMLVGAVVGLGGVALLVSPGSGTTGIAVSLAGASAIAISSLAWSIGSVYAHSIRPHTSAALFTAMQMLCGGAALLVLGLISGEPSRVSLASFTVPAVSSLLYLVVFGSLVGFSAFSFLLRVTTPARVATSAYVNPMVAVFLGWALHGERVDWRTLFAAIFIIGGVVLIRRGHSRRIVDARPTVSAGDLAPVTGEFPIPRGEGFPSA